MLYFRDNSISDSEIMEAQDSSDQEDEEDSRPSMTRELNEIMNNLSYMFPDRFSSDINESMPIAQRVFQCKPSTPRLKLNPELSGSWLDPPKSDDSDIGCWPKETKLPKGSMPYTKGYKFRPPNRPDNIVITDPNLKKLLEAPKIKEANLDPTIFRSTVATGFTGTSFSSTDVFLRGGLYDSFYSEELLSFALSFIPILKEQLSANFEGMDLSVFDFLEKLLAMTSLSNQRSYHNQIAALVSNKAGMRNFVLSKFNMPANTAQSLRGLNFACEGVFGDLPESFMAKFSTVSGGSLTCRPKGRPSYLTKSYASESLGGRKRASSSSTQARKRQRPNSSDQLFPWATKVSRGGGSSFRDSRFRGRNQKRR